MYPHCYPGQNSRRVWQTDFLRTNRLVLGHWAWSGFLEQGRGVLFCHVDPAVTFDLPHSYPPQLVRFNLQFVAASSVAVRIQDYGLGSAAVEELLHDLATYTPSETLILLLVAGEQAEAMLIQSSVAPPDCYQRVRERWSEFSPSCL